MEKALSHFANAESTPFNVYEQFSLAHLEPETFQDHLVNYLHLTQDKMLRGQQERHMALGLCTDFIRRNRNYGKIRGAIPFRLVVCWK